MIKRLFIFLFSFLFIFSSLPVYAAESESEDDSEGGLYSLLDVVKGVPEAVKQIKDIAHSFGVTASEDLNTYLVSPIKAAMSSFAATAYDSIADSFLALKNSDAFMGSVFLNPYTKSFSWGRSAGRHGGGELRPKYFSTVFYDVAPGFYRCDDTNYWGGWKSWYDSSDDCFFTAIGGNAVVCSGLSAEKSCRVSLLYSLSGNTHTAYSRFLESVYNHNGIDYKYWSGACNHFEGEFASKFPTFYTDVESAVSAFYSFSPHSAEEPNGSGYLRDIDINITASGRNVYNQDWDKIISNNYTTYGDTFNNTTINNYYYNSSSPETPNYWYDVYDPDINYDIDVLPDSLPDLNDVKFDTPDFTTNNNFIVSCFNAIPAKFSLLFVSLSVLFAAMVIFKKR